MEVYCSLTAIKAKLFKRTCSHEVMLMLLPVVSKHVKNLIIWSVFGMHKRRTLFGSLYPLKTSIY